MGGRNNTEQKKHTSNHTLYGGKVGICDAKQAGRDLEKKKAQRNYPNRRLYKDKAGSWECG